LLRTSLRGRLSKVVIFHRNDKDRADLLGRL